VYSGSRIHQNPQIRQLSIRPSGLFQFGTPTAGLDEKLGKPTARLNWAVTQIYINFIVYFHWLIPVWGSSGHALSTCVWRNRAGVTSLF